MKRMQNVVVLLMLMFVAIIMSGCSTLYGNEAQYDNGDWYFLGGSSEVARIKQDKLAFEKLTAQPAQTMMINGASMGYKGIVYNANREECDIRIYGPETKGFLMPPNMQDTIYLIPGEYTAQSCVNGSCGKRSKFRVSTQTHRFFGQDVHWYARCDE